MRPGRTPPTGADIADAAEMNRARVARHRARRRAAGGVQIEMMLSPAEAQALEALRRARGLDSPAATLRALIAEASGG